MSSYVATSSSGKERTQLRPPTSVELSDDPPKRRTNMMSSGFKRASRPPSLNRSLIPHSAPASRRQFSLDSFDSFGQSHTPRSTGSTPSFSNMQHDLIRALPTMSRSESLRMWEEGLVPTDSSQCSPQASMPVNRHYAGNYSLPSVNSEGRLEMIMDDDGIGVSEGGRVDWNKRSSSMRLDGQSSSKSMIAALQAEMEEGRKRESVDGYLVRMYESGLESEKEAFKLVNAGAVPLLIHLLRTRAADKYGVELVLIMLGTLAHNTISSNTIYRTGTTTTLIELCRSPPTLEVHTLAIWCLARICRSAEVAQSLIKQNLAAILLNMCKSMSAPFAAQDANKMVIPMALYTLGNLIQSDGIAEFMASMGLIPLIADRLSLATASLDPEPNIDALCSSIYALARISRSIKLAKSLAQAGCVELLSYHLKTSTDPIVLHWSARAVGCLMRPNSNDIVKILLEAGVAKGLGRLPTVLPQDRDYDVIVKPLGSFGFVIQRFSCAEWGGGTRKALVEAGVVDSLLAALRVV
ncbi:hypothetical protein E1B28_007946 [Marasmius oreades]|uniref:ARM repeat-containing protein n=1 Tax=Marasmius oreades TaxID=181124 RepID=A0A9P7S2P2_9AGAR|nr:uncharacterized protein E1B28_007946 [Marasmius oreades]KAG7094346.1 hypothetical protein E1B28_007946 [Marasmius oreades]